MIALMVTIQIKPEHQKAFIKSMLDDAIGSNRDEPGCLRFDVIQDKKDPNRIYLYEVYKDEAALEAHRNAPHFIKWRDTVKDWYAGERIRNEGIPIYPPENSWKKNKF